MKIKAIISLLLTFLSLNFAFSQNKNEFEIQIPDSGTVQVLKTTDGSKLIGTVISFDENEVLFQTENGTLEIKRDKIKSIKNFSESNVNFGEFFYPDPNVSRMFFAPKGEMLKQGNGYYQNIWLFFHNVTFGITDNITMGIGASLIPEAEEQIFFFTPKIGAKINKRFSLAGGILGINVPTDDGKFVGIAYGVGTYDIKKDVLDFTLGAGYGFNGSDFAESPMLMFGFEAKAGRNLALISENWTFPGVDNPLNSVGVRFFGEKIAVDLAFLFSATSDAGGFFPYLDFVYNF